MDEQRPKKDVSTTGEPTTRPPTTTGKTIGYSERPNFYDQPEKKKSSGVAQAGAAVIAVAIFAAGAYLTLKKPAIMPIAAPVTAPALAPASNPVNVNNTPQINRPVQPNQDQQVLRPTPGMGYCGVNGRAHAAQAKCSTVPLTTSLDEGCAGAGLVSCVPDAAIGDTGYNSAGDCLEVYCVNNKTRVCLTGEKCPWREDDNMSAQEYGQAFQFSGDMDETLDMTCSPYGLKFNGENATKMVYDENGTAPFQTVLCDSHGQLKIIKK